MTTTPFGTVFTIPKGKALPKRAMPGTITVSPFTTGLLSKPLLTRFSIPIPNSILCPSEIRGAIVTS